MTKNLFDAKDFKNIRGLDAFTNLPRLASFIYGLTNVESDDKQSRRIAKSLAIEVLGNIRRRIDEMERAS